MLLVDYYRPQVEMYSEFWKEMPGEDVMETRLSFVGAGKWVSFYYFLAIKCSV